MKIKGNMGTDGVQAICGDPPTGKGYKVGKNKDSTCTECALECFEAFGTKHFSSSKLG